MSMKTAILNPYVRIIKDENYEKLKSIENEIRERIQAEYTEEIEALRKQNEELHSEDKKFRAQAKVVLRKVTFEDTVKLSVQVGKGSTTIRHYVGKVVQYDGGDVFNVVVPDHMDGKEFTIGLSCLQSIKIQ